MDAGGLTWSKMSIFRLTLQLGTKKAKMAMEEVNENKDGMPFVRPDLSVAHGPTWRGPPTRTQAFVRACAVRNLNASTASVPVAGPGHT